MSHVKPQRSDYESKSEHQSDKYEIITKNKNNTLTKWRTVSHNWKHFQFITFSLNQILFFAPVSNCLSPWRRCEAPTANIYCYHTFKSSEQSFSSVNKWSLDLLITQNHMHNPFLCFTLLITRKFLICCFLLPDCSISFTWIFPIYFH